MSDVGCHIGLTGRLVCFVLCRRVPWTSIVKRVKTLTFYFEIWEDLFGNWRLRTSDRRTSDLKWRLRACYVDTDRSMQSSTANWRRWISKYLQLRGAGTRSENQVQETAEREPDVIGVFFCARAQGLWTNGDVVAEDHRWAARVSRLRASRKQQLFEVKHGKKSRPT